ncbi:hypothetical protein F53441_1925 [Fusarium austroafricanum]|uniref:Uncharacterized protein n=1 Tax=Fusarium austroafricanum TaxID=2364996 RepID=A0A8H4KUD3_9HYPO|nr:hypothetical protein F53441_1925 [Fusarium austroafricanum]
MPPRKSIRRRPATPNLNVAPIQTQVQVQDQNQPLTADPSPPETPTTSPPFSRKISLKPRRQPDFHDYFQPLDSDPNIKPTGDGHQFSYRPSMGPDQMSPRSSSSSDMADNSSDEDSSSEDEDDSASPSIRSIGNATGPPVSSPIGDDDSDVELDDDTDNSSDSESSESDSGSESDRSGATDEAETSHITVTSTATATATLGCNFTVEDIDPMDSDCDGLDVLHPTEIESNRSRSRSRSRKAHKTMVKDFRNLTCSNETSDNEQSPEGEGELDEEAQFLRRREHLKKFRRMSMGSSFGKRTHSELSDSEDDGEGLDANEVGSSARRMRRKMHRTSLLFHDPPPARIEELDEPDSSEDELVAHQHLARELPYWAIEIMEMGSSSS